MGIIVGMLLAGNVNAQVGYLEWLKPFVLPSEENGKKHIGLAGPIAGLSGDYLLIGGGANFPDRLPWEGGIKKVHNQVFIYTKDGDDLSLIGKDVLPVGVAYGTSVSIPKIGLLVIGGETEHGKTKRCKLLNYDRQTKKITIADFPDLPGPLSNMGAICVGNKVLVAGGEGPYGVSDQVYQIDLQRSEKGWTVVGKLPYPVSHLQLLTDDDNIYLVGGRMANKNAASTLYQALLKSSDGGKHWVNLPDIPFKAAAGTSCILPDHGIWILSADRGDTFAAVENLIAQAQQETDPIEAQRLTESKNKLQRNHPGFGKEIWRFDLHEQTWEKAGELPCTGPVTTTVIIWDDMVILPSGEIRAGIRTPKIIRAVFKKQR